MGAEPERLRLAVVGAGWAGLAAAVRATQAGCAVTLLEMAPQAGGRARALAADAAGSISGAVVDTAADDRAEPALDNGQHILIGAYQRTLDLMRTVGADVAGGLARRPLELRYPDGRGLRLPPGPPALAFLRGVAGCVGWTARDKLALLATAARWLLQGFRCSPKMTVATLCTGLPPAVRSLLVDPLCVAALNTPATEASAAVFLHVLRDALFGGRGAADLLLPRRSLSALLPEPALLWLAAAGAQVRLGSRVRTLARSGASVAGDGWLVDGEPFDAVVLACSAQEAARLAAPHAPAWATAAAALQYEPITTVYLQAPGARLPAPMTALPDGPDAPAQFAFDHGALGGVPGRFAFVVSGAGPWAARGQAATAAAVLQQAADAFSPATWPAQPAVLRVITEKRATFRCTPALRRPAAGVAPGLVAAGDYIAGPYPATLESAVRAGEAAALAVCVRRPGPGVPRQRRSAAPTIAAQTARPAARR